MQALFYKGEDFSVTFHSEYNMSNFTKTVKFFTPFSAVKNATITQVNANTFTANFAAADTADLTVGRLNIILEFTLSGKKSISKTINATIADPQLDGGERVTNGAVDADVIFIDNDAIEIDVLFNVDTQLVAQTIELKNTALSNKALENLRQVFYRNLEGDNQLPITDFGGRTRPIQTPITLISIDDENKEYILANMPFVLDIKKNPANWTIYSVNSEWTEYGSTAARIITAEYIDDVTVDEITYTNCLRITTNSVIDGTTLNDPMVVTSFIAYGREPRLNPVIDIDGVSGSWKKDETGMQLMYRHSDGRYIGMINGDNKSNPAMTYARRKIIYTDDPINGTWQALLSDIEAESDDILDMNILPSPYVTFKTILRVERMEGKDGIYIGAIDLCNNLRQTQAIGLLMFDEDWKYRKIIVPTIDYSFTIGLDVNGWGLTYTNYKGKHLITFQDGLFNSGKRIVVSSKYLEGPYTYHSTIYDYTADTWMKQSGSMFAYSITHNTLFVYNGELYNISTGQTNSKPEGSGGRHHAYLWKYNDSDGKWNLCIHPFLTAFNAKPGEFPELGNITWGNRHLGQMVPQFIENGSMYLTGIIKGSKDLTAPDAYRSAIIKINLHEALL